VLDATARLRMCKILAELSTECERERELPLAVVLQGVRALIASANQTAELSASQFFADLTSYVWEKLKEKAH
jgi:hypothetical protein